MNIFQLCSGMIAPTLFVVVVLLVFNQLAIFLSYRARWAHHRLRQKMCELQKLHCWPFWRPNQICIRWRTHNSLTLRLSCYIFYCKYLKVAKRFVSVANQLHEGRDICLSRLILGYLQESLRLASHALKNFSDKNTLLFVGPFWLL